MCHACTLLLTSRDRGGERQAQSNRALVLPTRKLTIVCRCACSSIFVGGTRIFACLCADEWQYCVTDSEMRLIGWQESATDDRTSRDYMALHVYACAHSVFIQLLPRNASTHSLTQSRVPKRDQRQKPAYSHHPFMITHLCADVSNQTVLIQQQHNRH